MSEIPGDARLEEPLCPLGEVAPPVYGVRRRSALAFALLALLALLGAAAPAPGARSGPADAADRARLAAGETVTELREVPGHRVGEAAAWRILDAPAGRLLRAVADWPSYPEFFPFVVAATARAEAAGRTTFRHTVDLPFPFPDRSFAAVAEAAVVEEGPDGRALVLRWTIRREASGFADQRGSWTLREVAPGRTRVELRVASDAGEDVPAAFQRRVAERTLRWALDGLRQHVRRCRYDVPRPDGCTETPAFPPPTGTAAAR